MKISDTHVRTASVHLSLGDDAPFDLPFEGYGRRERRGLTLRVRRLVGYVDLETGEITVRAYGSLLNSNGEVGLRDRDMFLDVEQVPEEAKALLARAFDEIAATIVSVERVTFA